MSIVLQESLRVNSFSELKSIFKGDGRYDFFTDGVEIETVIQNVDRGAEGRLFVLFSGARDPSKQPLPKFDKWKWVNSFPGIVVNISDPTLYFHEKRLRIGWYYGTKEKNYSFLISGLVKNLADFFSIGTSNVIFYGSSAGGFASICCSSLVENSTAVAINPQIVLSKYSEGPYKRFLSASLGVGSDIEISELQRKRMDAAKLFLEGGNNKCLYVQNVKDFSHFENHYSYFCDISKAKILGGESDCGRVKTWLYSSENGHGPEPYSMVSEIIEESIALSKRPVGRDVWPKKEHDNTYQILGKSFLISDSDPTDHPPGLSSYNKKSLYGFNFFFSDRLRFSLCDKNNVALLVIGISIHIEDPGLDEAGIASFLHSSWGVSREDFYESLDCLSGSFLVVVFDKSSGAYVFTDACGTYGVFYSEKNKGFCISSHAFLVSKFIGSEISDFQRYWTKHPAFSAGGKYYPGNLTEFDSVLQLTPNTYISYVERIPVRYFPRKKLPSEREVEDIVSFIKSSLENQLFGLVNRYKLTMSLSGGLDSRVSLAVSKNVKEKISYFTYSIRGNRYLKKDLEVARELSYKLGLQHDEVVVKSGDPVSPQVFQQLEINSPGNTANADLTQAYVDFFGCDDDRVHIRSNLMEIVREYYLSNPANLRNAYTPRKISGLFRGATREEFSSVFDSFLRDVQFHKTAGKGYHYSDLFYWEHRMGVFVSNVAKRERPIHETVMLFNNRKILDAALSLPLEKRVSAELFYNLIASSWPETLDVPMSSGSKLYTYIAHKL